MKVIDMVSCDVSIVEAAVCCWQCDAAGRDSMCSEEFEEVFSDTESIEGAGNAGTRAWGASAAGA